MAFRDGADFAWPEICHALEKRGAKYAVRFPANHDPERKIQEVLTRRTGQPGQKSVGRYRGFLFQAASWKTTR